MLEQLKQKLDEQMLDFWFFSSQGVKEYALELLQQLLKEEKSHFYQKLSLSDEELTFDALEDESYLSTFFGLIEHFNSVQSDDEFRKIIEEFEPLYIEWGNEISYNQDYYNTLQKVLKKWNLDSDQERILKESIKNYRIRWIDLPKKEQEKLKDINQKLAELHQKFSNNVLDSEAEFRYLITDESVLTQMPEDEKEIAQKRASSEGKEGWLFDASRWSYSSIITYCSDRDIRKHFYTEKYRFATDGKFDNRQIVLEILRLRNEKARILSYDNYADYGFEFKMASSPNQIKELLLSVSKKAKEKASEEITVLKDFLWITDVNYWDTSYYIRKYKEQKFWFDEKLLKPYFEIETTFEWMISLASDLFWLEFNEIRDKEPYKYSPDIRLYEVEKDGILKAYFIVDYFHRKGKRPGAWANDLRSKFIQKGKNKLPIIVNVWNFQKNEWNATLIPLRDVETMFHEFWHALHWMLGESTYSELGGFWVEWDFVELPSQLMENWCREKEALDRFAVHYQTGESIPESIIQTLHDSEMFWKWIFLLTQSMYAYLDMVFHTSDIPPNISELTPFVSDVVKEFSLFERQDSYNPYSTWHHVFDGGYAAGYYSYMWAEIIEAQVWWVFKKEGILNPSVWKKYYDIVLAQWSRKNGFEIFKEFTGQEMNLNDFFQRYGI
jgi:Zn-dependent oligopeptidase